MKLALIKLALFAMAMMGLGHLLMACSALDGSDRADLEAGINKESPEVKHAMAAMAMNQKTKRFLDGRPPSERVIGVECKQRLPGGSWFNPKPEQDLVYLVSDVIECMSTGETYQGCIATLAAALVIKATDRWQAKIAASIPGSLDASLEVSCNEVVDPQYHPANVPGADTDLNKVSAGEIVEWLLALPAPPPGFSIEAWAPILPFICAMDVSWGCPGDPHNPIITGVTTGGAGGGSS